MWPLVAISDFCQTSSGGTPKRGDASSYYGGDIPWVKSGELLDAPLRETVEKITDLALRESSAKIVPAGTVLVAMYGATVGRTALLEIDAATNQAVCSVIPDKHLASNRYVWYALRASYGDLIAKRVGGAQPNISQQIVRSTKLPLPALSEQARIVELLDEADRLRRLSREADAKATRILPALFLKMFGDPTTNSMGWPIGTLGDVLNATEYGTSTRASDDGSGLPLIRMGNVSYEGNLQLRDLKYVELPESEVAKFRLERGDILFNRTNSKELVGKTGLWDVDMDAVLASYFIRVRVNPEQAEPTFLWAFLNSAHMKRVLLATARGAIGQANINTSELRAFPMYKPPLAVQRSFTEKVAAIRSTLQASFTLKHLEDLFALILQRALSGQLTAKWREAHLKELLAEMEVQARQLNLPLPQEAAV
jgi:type I restriction enzyme S subunit